ncbi:MAG TPA: serine/threonine-protein phosphatase, partial [Bacteroidetes bacterium]|nr:serine/threonine-protein phosphatase [Bacteroidota bacterium]
FDFIGINEHCTAVCLGDVSGKGLPAAILMANLQAAIRSQALLNASARECTERSNRLLFHNTDMGKFVTFFYGVLNAAENKLCFSNAGHDNPFLFKNGGEILRLKTGGIVLGFIENVSFEQEDVSLESGDIMLVYSDGITEAMNPDEEEFGEERLVEIVMNSKESSAWGIIDRILEDVGTFTRNKPQMDDMTLVVVKKL